MHDNNLTAFKVYLDSKSAVNPKYVPYYVHWVSACYGLLNLSCSEVLSSEQKQQFVKHAAKSHEDWQVKLADYFTVKVERLRVFMNFLIAAK